MDPRRNKKRVIVKLAPKPRIDARYQSLSKRSTFFDLSGFFLQLGRQPGEEWQKSAHVAVLFTLKNVQHIGKMAINLEVLLKEFDVAGKKLA